jgi:TPR repeat protein
MLLRRGQELLNTGDIASARLAFRRAANGGSAPAALALGGSYDPFVLAELGVLGLAPDIAQARAWYERASALGSSEAPRRLERLPRAER